MKKTLFNILPWLNEAGPFITLVLPSSFDIKESGRNKLLFKNLSKDAKDKLADRYPDVDFSPFDTHLKQVYNDHEIWRTGANAFYFLSNGQNSALLKLGIEVEPHSYVDDIPYLIPLVHDLQLLTHFYILALNRDSFKLFEYSNRELIEVLLPDDAPTTLEKALGDDLTTSGVAHGSGRVFAGSNRGYYGGVGTSRDERAVDRLNYFYAVERYLRENRILDKNIQIELYTLPENRSVFLDISKLINLDDDMGILLSPKDFNTNVIISETEKSVDAKNKRTIDKLYNDLDRYTANNRISKDFVKIKELAEYGAIQYLIVSYDRLDKHDYEVNQIIFDIMQSGGDAYILKSDQKLGPEKITALLRYTL